MRTGVDGTREKKKRQAERVLPKVAENLPEVARKLPFLTW
jgi:hypothetical protein